MKAPSGIAQDIAVGNGGAGAHAFAAANALGFIPQNIRAAGIRPAGQTGAPAVAFMLPESDVITVGVLLEQAVPGFLTGEAVIGMIVQIQAQDTPARFYHALGFSVNHHAAAHHGGTAGFQTVAAFNLNQAHPAGTVDGQIFVIA
ncbi:hypothetical protein SDC9_183967 [bioreactor metagenome]|uniref:Uncharacterized protein n=1 Tax=bioreactor metagenome TaxID=1076179 RepID=A0A645HBP7_9ZZZZ